jgi:ATP phosphoribosyltransferase
MRAAGLEVVSTIMGTEAVLIGNKNSPHKDLMAKIATRCRGVVTAEQYVMIEYNIPRASLAQACTITPGHTSPTIQPLENEAWCAVKCMVERRDVHDKMDALQAIGATDILVTDIKNCRV